MDKRDHGYHLAVYGEMIPFRIIKVRFERIIMLKFYYQKSIRWKVWICLFVLLIGSIAPVSSGKANELEIEKPADARIEWIEAYRTFLTNDARTITGFNPRPYEIADGYFYDMDHDGTPELILKKFNVNEPYSPVTDANAYTYSNNAVEYLGPASPNPYLSFADGYSGNLYGLFYKDPYSNDGLVLYEYAKEDSAYFSKMIWESDQDSRGTEYLMSNYRMFNLCGTIERIGQSLEGDRSGFALDYNYAEGGVIVSCLAKLIVCVRTEAAGGLFKSLGDFDGVLLAVDSDVVSHFSSLSGYWLPPVVFLFFRGFPLFFMV